jgi:hypothetical protein
MLFDPQEKMSPKGIFEWFRPRNYNQQDIVFDCQPPSQNNILCPQVYMLFDP